MNTAILSEFISIGRAQRLVFTEAAAACITALCKVPYRLSVAGGHWPPHGRPPEDCQMRMIQAIAHMRNNARMDPQIPALSSEEFGAAMLLLELFDFCEGRGIELGRIVNLVHLHRAKNFEILVRK